MNGLDDKSALTHELRAAATMGARGPRALLPEAPVIAWHHKRAQQLQARVAAEVTG